MSQILNVSFSDDKITFVNPKTNKAIVETLGDNLVDNDAIRIVNNEIKHRSSVSNASVALLSRILDNPRLDGYKGQTPINETIPKELKQAIRDLETEYLKPLFVQPLVDKGNKPATIESLWQNFASGLRDGGGYANAKSRVVAYFAHCGKLPTHNKKLLTIASIDKLLANAKALETPKESEGIAGKLVSLSIDIENRTEKTDLGDYPTAISALKSMLNTYEGLYRESLETLTMLHQTNGVATMANNAMQKPSIESLDAMHENGQIDDTTYAIMMLEHHNIDIVFEEELV
jgi:hypothetical protein